MAIPNNGPKPQIQGWSLNEKSKTVLDNTPTAISAPRAPRRPETSPNARNSISCTKTTFLRAHPKVLSTALSRIRSLIDKWTDVISTIIPQNKINTVIASRARVT